MVFYIKWQGWLMAALGALQAPFIIAQRKKYKLIAIYI